MADLLVRWGMWDFKKLGGGENPSNGLMILKWGVGGGGGDQTQDFKHKKYMKCTKLSKYIWSLKNQYITPIVKWRIAKKVNTKVSPNFCQRLQFDKKKI